MKILFSNSANIYTNQHHTSKELQKLQIKISFSQFKDWKYLNATGFWNYHENVNFTKIIGAYCSVLQSCSAAQLLLLFSETWDWPILTVKKCAKFQNPVGFEYFQPLNGENEIFKTNKQERLNSDLDFPTASKDSIWYFCLFWHDFT